MVVKKKLEKKAVKRQRHITVYLTKSELKAAMIACGNYHGSLCKSPRNQKRAWKTLQSVYITHEIYG